MDFVFDRTADGRSIKNLTLVDGATHEAVAVPLSASSFNAFPGSFRVQMLGCGQSMARMTGGMPTVHKILTPPCHNPGAASLRLLAVARPGRVLTRPFC